ncbi:phage gp6-like head-tail connector protein [Sinorhizobium meliloti]|uniref:head-tail connector protein n=1 Tax=Rhizobium meliloti TaxID=382 RepID=UPI00299F2901|nr:phage gp6-like head-tail connector protein [Sinorhizobium meliloti]
MEAVSLAEAKAHLRIGFTSDDAYVTSLLEAAEGYVSEIGVALAAPVPAPVKHAILLLVSHWYGAREAAATEPPKAIAFGVDALLQPFREQNL